LYINLDDQREENVWKLMNKDNASCV